MPVKEDHFMSKPRLGRGLNALLGDCYDEEDQVPAIALLSPEGREALSLDNDLAYIRVCEIDPNPYQPRRSFDALELAGLVESIQQHGVLQPVVVRRVGDRFQLIAGERRLRAAQEAGLAAIPARIRQADDQQVFELAFVENLQRTDLNSIEKARAFREYLDRFGSTQDELSTRLGLDRSTVSNFIRLLELPLAIQQAVESAKISQGHARALLSFNDASRQHELCRRVISEGLSVRQVEALVAAERPKPKAGARPNPHRTSHVAELEGVLRERLGTQVEIRLRGKDRGQIVIDFSSNDEFERIVETIEGQPMKTVSA
jgi:ParB family chromosome partitioning protein